MPISATERTAELYVRSLAPGEAYRQQERVIERLESLVERGVLTDYDVQVWGDALCRSAVSAHVQTGRHIRNRLEQIERWTDESGHSVETFYRTVEHRSDVTGESRVETRFPALTLAEFEGDTLVHVAPCHDGDRLVTIADRLEQLERNTPSRVGREVNVVDLP